MRAMSVRVNEVVGVAGFIVPGSRVDVMVILRGQKSDGLARTVVSNVQVLTAGTRSDQENSKRDGKAVPSTVVTVMVSPNDAERIALAQAEGQIMLALRNPLDEEPTTTAGVRTAALLSGNGVSLAAQDEPAAPVAKPKPKPVAAAPPPPPAPEAPKLYTVEAIRAAKRTEEAVR
jgi:pilus assembly protein CpaB